jgi:putative endonuclease
MKKRKKRKFKRSGKFWVYIVQCSNKAFYTGYTPNLKKRIELHNAGKGAKYTRDRRPVKLVWSKKYKKFKPAFKLEKIIKQLTRLEKESLVNGKGLDKVLFDAGIKGKCEHANQEFS